MNQLHFFYLCVVILFTACNIGTENANSKSEVSKNTLHVFDIRDIKNTISLSLSDFVTDISFVRIETSDKALISKGEWLVGDKYIIVNEPKQGIYQFNRKGDFIRQLAIVGRGPHDVQSVLMASTKNNERLIVCKIKRGANYFLNIDLNTGQFLADVPKNIEPGYLANMFLLDDTVIVCGTIAGTSFDDRAYYYYSQTFSGDLIDTIPIKDKVMSHWNQEDRLYKIGNHFHYRNSCSDTILMVKHNKFIPNYVFNSDRNGVNIKPKPGNIFFNITADTKEYFLLKRLIIDKIKIVERGGIATYFSSKGFVYVDKSKNSASLIESFKNDITGDNELSHHASFQPDGYFCLPIQAIDMIQKIKELEKDENITVKNREQLLALKEKIDENDNPILLIGRLK